MGILSASENIIVGHDRFSKFYSFALSASVPMMRLVYYKVFCVWWGRGGGSVVWKPLEWPLVNLYPLILKSFIMQIALISMDSHGSLQVNKFITCFCELKSTFVREQLFYPAFSLRLYSFICLLKHFTPPFGVVQGTLQCVFFFSSNHNKI